MQRIPVRPGRAPLEAAPVCPGAHPVPTVQMRAVHEGRNARSGTSPLQHRRKAAAKPGQGGVASRWAQVLRTPVFSRSENTVWKRAIEIAARVSRRKLRDGYSSRPNSATAITGQAEAISTLPKVQCRKASHSGQPSRTARGYRAASGRFLKAGCPPPSLQGNAPRCGVVRRWRRARSWMAHLPRVASDQVDPPSSDNISRPLPESAARRWGAAEMDAR